MGIISRLQGKGGECRPVKLSWLSPFWVFLVFFGVMLVQNRYVFIYHDDYGYASLSYAINIQSVHGHTFSLSQLVAYLTGHYNLWGGGVIAKGIEIMALRWGVWPFRILQSVVLTMILVSAYKLLNIFYKREITRWLIAFTLCCCYGLIAIQLHRDGTYWPTASVSYVWPFLVLFIAATIHLRLVNGRQDRWLLPIMGVLYFVAGAAQEQIGLISVVFVSGLLLTHLWLKKGRSVLFVDSIAILFVLVGFAFLILAPGNLVRLGNPIYTFFRGMVLSDRLQLTLPNILQINFGRQNQAILLLWTWLCVAVMWASYRARKRPPLIYLFTFLICVFFGLVLTVSLIPALSSIENWIYQPPSSIGPFLFWVGFLCAVSLAVVLFCVEKGLYALIALFVGGILSQVIMVASPTWNLRSSLIFLFTLFPVLAAMLGEVVPEVRGQLLASLALLIIFTAAAFNTAVIVHGYAANSLVMESNDRLLRQAAQAIPEGAIVQKIRLKTLPNDLYAAEMPYSPGYEYINWWIKEYYDLPLDIDLNWK